jgi:FkbM family methyltransferase
MHLVATTSRATALLTKNPGLFCRVLLAKINATRHIPPLPARKRIDDVVFEFDKGPYRETAAMYFGSYAIPIVETMKRILNRGDVFFDIGANIGYLSAIGASIVGPEGQVHCFEPVTEYFHRVQRLADLNPTYAITANACGAGEVPGSCTIYVTREPGQNTMVANYKQGPEIVSTQKVQMVRLDSYIENYGLEGVRLIKIDAEGFELPILKGLENFFRRSKCRPEVICEIAPKAYSLMGRKVSELCNYMSDYGYVARDLFDGVTPVDLQAMRHVDDVLFSAESKP